MMEVHDSQLKMLKYMMDNIIEGINARHIYNTEPIKYSLKIDHGKEVYERILDANEEEAMMLSRVAIARALIFGDIQTRMTNPVIGIISERIRMARDGEIDAKETLDWLLAIFRNGIGG